MEIFYKAIENDDKYTKKVDDLEIKKTIINDSPTYNFIGYKSIYSETMPKNANIFDNAIRYSNKISNTSLKNRFDEFIKTFKDIFYSYSLNKIIKRNIPPLSVSKDKDGAIILNWNFLYARIGFILEKDSNKSSFFRVENNFDTGGFKSISGKLNEDNYQKIIKDTINFVFYNL